MCSTKSISILFIAFLLLSLVNQFSCDDQESETVKDTDEVIEVNFKF